MEGALHDRAEAGRGLDADDVCRKEIPTACASVHRRRKRSWKRARCRMDDSAEMSIVEVEAVAEKPIHDSGIARGEPSGHANYRNRPRAAQSRDSVQRPVSEVELGGREGDSNCVERMVTRSRPDFFRNVLMTQIGGEARKCMGRLADGGRIFDE